MEKIVEVLSALDLFNLAMALGSIAMLFAIHQIGKENKQLHERNRQERAKDRSIYGDDGAQPLHL